MSTTVETTGADIDEAAWVETGSKNEVFEFLKDDAEDIYTLDDGIPLDNEI